MTGSVPRAAGGYAEFVTAPSRQFARKPRSLTHEQAAAVPLAALTAWQTLIDTAHVQPRQRVLIHAAAGAAGVRATPFLVEPDGTALTRIAELIDAGTIRVEVEEVFPLAEVARAHARGQANRTRGKLVLHVAS